MISKAEHKRQLVGIAKRRLQSHQTRTQYKNELREALADGED